MEKRLLIFVCITFTVLAGTLFYTMSLTDILHQAAIKYAHSKIEDFEGSVSEYFLSNNDLTGEDGRTHSVRMEFPTDIEYDVAFEEDFNKKSLCVITRGLENSYFQDFPMIGNSDGIKDIVFSNSAKESRIDIFFEEYLFCNYVKEGQYWYLDFKRPKEIFDTIVVIDAGHGGEDGGANSQGIEEKDINLNIAKKIEAVFSGYKDERIGVFLTRNEDETLSLDDRCEFANNIEADILVSIHQNSTSSGRMSNINGTEVLYLSSDETGESKRLSELLLYKIEESLGSNNRGLVAGDNLILLSKVNCPTALVEVGFMTNRDELNKLQDENYQQRCAEAVFSAIMEKLNENSNSNRQ